MRTSWRWFPLPSGGLAATVARRALSTKSKRTTRTSRSEASVEPPWKPPASPPSATMTVTSSSVGTADAKRESKVDEVERLLAATSTRRTSTSGRDTAAEAASLPPVPLTSSLLTPTTGTTSGMGRSIVDTSSSLHFRAVHEAAVSTSGKDGPTHAQLRQIERRRSKPSLFEAEIDVGMTERLVPELPRLPALHEVHYGDAVVRELDRASYFALQTSSPSRHLEKSMLVAAPNVSAAPATAFASPAQRSASPADVVLINGTACRELSLDDDLNDNAFAAFDAEVNSSPLPSDAAMRGNGGAPANDVAGVTPAAEKREEEEGEFGQGSELVEEEEKQQQQLEVGTERPWFVPASGVVQLHALSPDDCATLLRFVLHLRGQSEADLVPSLRRALAAAEEPPSCAEGAVVEQKEEEEERGKTAPRRGCFSPHRAPLTLADVHRYLDTAPPPVIALTESLPSPPSSSSSTSVLPVAQHNEGRGGGGSSTHDHGNGSPAFLFHLYLENVSSQNAVGHLCALFSIPLRCVQTHTAVSKMSCSTVLCAISENRVRREHLLLLNTMRHPGFVLRVSDVREITKEVYAAHRNGAAAASSFSLSDCLFRDLALWQPLYHTEVILRRVGGSSNDSSAASIRQQLEHRLRAVGTVGAIFFCGNREASLARAATDVLHGFFRSAVLNALQRRKAPIPLTNFLRHPNVATAQRAHHVSTDPTVRQVLKVFVQTNGDWHATVVRTPYVWRRRWINALRGLVWNTFASLRIRKGGRAVCLGDVVLKPEYRADVHRRGIVTVKAEHVMVVRTAAEAQAACMEDVFLPFLRGRYPEHLFADEATGHPVMTRSNMLALLRAMHAPQLLLGFTEELRLLLDVRADVSPLLFRRLLIRPLAFEFAILEDKPPMRALHYDAARLLTSDRWLVAAGQETRGGEAPVSPLSRDSTAAERIRSRSQQADGSRLQDRSPTGSAMRACHLLPPSVVLERTTLGSRLASGVLAEDFFTIPPPDDFVVLGHTHRQLSGNFIAAAPLSDTAAVGDRVYSIYIRAVVEHNVAGLSSLLREYFQLSAIETQLEGALQHKVHRLRRELDPEAAVLTAPVYCTTCYNRDHDTQEQCAEHQFKRHRRGAQYDVEAVVAGRGTTTSATTTTAALALGRTSESSGESPALSDTSVTYTARMRWQLRRRNEDQRWGVHLTKKLELLGLEDAALVRETWVWCSATGAAADSNVALTGKPEAAKEASPWPSALLSFRSMPTLWHLLRRALQMSSGSSSSSSNKTAQDDQAVPLSSSTVDNNDKQDDDALARYLAQTKVLNLSTAAAAATWQLPSKTPAGTPGGAGATEHKSGLQKSGWHLAWVNDTPVATQRDVAVALLSGAKKAREVSLTFEHPLPLAATKKGHDGGRGVAAGGSETSQRDSKKVGDEARAASPPPSTASSTPQSTSSMSPERRREHEAIICDALRQASSESRQQLHRLPHRVTVVLAKSRQHALAHPSWSLRLDGADLTLVNFAELVRAYATAAAPATATEADGSAASRWDPHTRVVSITLGEAGRRDGAAVGDPLLGQLACALAPVLNDFYRVVRLHNTPVQDREGAANAMKMFQASLEQQQQRTALDGAEAVADVGYGSAAASPPSPPFLLTLTLERKRSSYDLRTALTTVADAAREATVQPPARATSEAETAAAALATVTAVDPAFLAGFATSQCRVQPLTALQLSRSLVTIAVNRGCLTDATRGRWGLRLQHGTRRLKAIHQNRNFGFRVFAAKASQGTRISDGLRLMEKDDDASRNGVEAATSSSSAAATATVAHEEPRTHFLYYVEAVNQTTVHTHAALREALRVAAEPMLMQPRGSNQGSGGSDDASSSSSPAVGVGVDPGTALTVSALPPESVTLRVRQFALLRLTATVRRGGVGEESALGPVGLQVDRQMRLVAVFADSPAARAVEEAAGPQCSLRRLIRKRGERTAGDTAASQELPSAAAWAVVEEPRLRSLVSRLASAIAGAAQEDVRGGTAQRAQQQPSKVRQWTYSKDEDEEEAEANAAATVLPDSTATSRTASAPSVAAPDSHAALPLLREIASAAAYTQQQCSRCSMVDGVHLLQASLLQEYANVALAEFAQSCQCSSSFTAEGLAALHQRLAAVHQQVRWSVTYAARCKRALQTPADLAIAFAPGVAEEEVSLQQHIGQF